MSKFNIFNVIGEVNKELEIKISDFLTKVLESEDTRPILLLINSSGGNVMTGFSIYNKLRSMPNEVITVITGQCSSIANVIFFAAAKKNRYAYENTFFFMHSIHTNVSDCSPTAVRDIRDELQRTNADIAAIIGNDSNISEKLLDAIYGECYKEKRITSDEFSDYSIAKVITKLDDIATSSK